MNTKTGLEPSRQQPLIKYLCYKKEKLPTKPTKMESTMKEFS